MQQLVCFGLKSIRAIQKNFKKKPGFKHLSFNYIFADPDVIFCSGSAFLRYALTEFDVFSQIMQQHLVIVLWRGGGQIVLWRGGGSKNFMRGEEKI